jgi:hypothetical protein
VVSVSPNEEKHMSAAAPRSEEVRVAEQYLSVLADVSVCMEAVLDGDWRSLTDAAEDLGRRAALLAELAGRLQHDQPGLGGEVVAAMVASRNSSRAARLLHPAHAVTIDKTAMTDPFTHPGNQPDR